MEAERYDVATLIERARDLAVPGQRRLLGITGPPGAGKSTLATALVAGLEGLAVETPMDGFHLANQVLAGLGRADRKGAPDTFDLAGYLALLRRLKERSDEVVYAPAFRREIEEPIAQAIAVPRRIPLVVTDGNYLLLDGPWAAVSELLDEIWYVDLPDEIRIHERLVPRHVRHGRAPDAALAWSIGSDQANAELIARTRHRADLVVRLTP